MNGINRQRVTSSSTGDCSAGNTEPSGSVTSNSRPSTRRSSTAMPGTSSSNAGPRAVLSTWRPVLSSRIAPCASNCQRRGAWEIGSPVLLDPQGNRVETRSPCAVPGLVQSGCTGYQFLVAYQPADRFWRFQAIESGFYVVLAALLLALTAYW